MVNKKCPQCGKSTFRPMTSHEQSLAVEDWRDAGSREDERQDWDNLYICDDCGYQDDSRICPVCYGSGIHPSKGDGIHDYCDKCEGSGIIF